MRRYLLVILALCAAGFGFGSVDQGGAVAVSNSTSQTFVVGDMVDGGGTTGTIAFTDQIPIGAVTQRTLCHTLTGFTGDSTASIQVGDGSTVNRYNTSTPSVFANNVAGRDMGAPSGALFHTAAETVTVTITSATDFSLVSEGEITCVVFYWAP